MKIGTIDVMDRCRWRCVDILAKGRSVKLSGRGDPDNVNCCREALKWSQ
jgi:hypothetical protein